ncbi:MAG: hypothetical protein HY320_07980 [Armatimonadetes bacterium]|nr:hypothetical protein [Armatimonadota bacterium]
MVTPNISSILQNHVSLSVTCIDRLYLNGYVPKLQTAGQVCYFLREHLGYPIPSPALFRPMHDRFVHAVQAFAADHHIPVVQFARGQRKDDLAALHRARFTAAEGVVVIGVAQERALSFKAQRVTEGGGGFHFAFSRQPVAVNHYYFYLQDRDWGPAFVKVGTYLPYPVRVCLNGHEWVKQQVRREGIAFESLDNGFLSCAQPERLQALCDALGPHAVQAFFDRWVERLPWPLTAADRAAGFGHRLAIWQVEVSLTQVFDQPVQGRHFFEALIRENLDLGRPDRVSLLFPTRLTRATPAPPHGYRTRVLTAGVNPSLHLAHKHSHVKQYFKQERALRTETTINDPTDFRSPKGLAHLPYLRAAGAQVNRKLLEVERLTDACILTQAALDRLQRPTQEAGGRAPGLRFGDPRVMALFQALCGFAHLPQGFRNRDLRPRVAALLGLDETTYTAGRMTYDLRRLRLKGLLHRIPGTTRYTVTTYGLHVALFCTKVFLRILRPGWAALTPDADGLPRPLRDALLQVDVEIQKLCAAANLQPAA